jgi:hypothetical protein
LKLKRANIMNFACLSDLQFLNKLLQQP